MKRQINSNRSNKWIKRNSLNYENCRNYVILLCETQFNFKNFKIDFFNSVEKALWLTYGIHSYIIFVSYENICLLVLETINNINNKYHEIKKFSGDACWYNCLSWIKNRDVF